MKKIISILVLAAICGITHAQTLVTPMPIKGVASPVAGAPPATTIVTETTEYTGTIIWAPNDNPFDYGTMYTAIITLTAEPGYTFSGDFASLLDIAAFTVDGASPTNLIANTGATLEFEVEFPKTDPLVNAAPPDITVQPQPNTYNHNASATALSVTVSSLTDGGILSYQWYSNGANSTVGATPVGTNINTYTPSTSAIGTLYYYVVVTNTNSGVNGATTASVTSSIVSITVNPIVNAQTPTITGQPQTNTYNHNASATALSVTVSSLTDGGIQIGRAHV